jgi:alpha-1,2-mannosyltransferase
VEAQMESLSNRRAVRSAWIGWAALFLVVAAMILSGTDRTVVPSYRIAALNWLAGRGLYDGTGIGGFVYFPQAAILFVPFALLPQALGEVLWRLVIIGAFAVSLRGFAALAGGKTGKELFPLMTFVAIPLAWDCARNGQATLIMTGFMLLAVADAARNRWWRATLWLALGVAIKPLAIVLVLLIAAIDRPATWRVFLGMIVLALLPFAAQHPAYVLQQYSACLQNMTTAAHIAVAAHGWTSPFTALRAVAGVDVPEHIQTVMRLVGAAVTLGLCFFTRRLHDAGRSAVFLFSLAVLYLMIFSPRTENNTYAMLGPAMGVFLAEAFLVEKRTGVGILLTGMVLALVGSRWIERLLAPRADAIWLSPLIAICFAVYFFVRFFADTKKQTNEVHRSGAGHHEGAL